MEGNSHILSSQFFRKFFEQHPRPVFIFNGSGQYLGGNVASKAVQHLFVNKDVAREDVRKLLHKKNKPYTEIITIESNSYELEITTDSDIFLVYVYQIENTKTTLRSSATIVNNLKKQKKLLADLLDNLPMTIFIKNYEGRLIYINKYYEQIRNTSGEDLLGKTAHEYLPKEVADEIEKEEHLVWSTSEPALSEREIEVDGEIRYFQTGKILFEIKNEKALLGYSIDITERKKIEEETIKARTEAEESNKAKEQFISVMSHEIRTPMNTVIGMTNLLLRSKHFPEQRDYLNALKTSSDNLLAIVNDILDMSKIEAGMILFEEVDFNLEEHLLEIKNTFDFKAAEKNIIIKLEVDKSIPQVINGDPFRLNQILLNLVSNSLKFTEQGYIEIKVDKIETSETNSIPLLFSIKDTGIGIPEEKLSMIFESFTQAENNISRKYGGTGLGLTITKKLIELQGGSIGVESKVNSGSKFVFFLNFKKASNPARKKTVPENINTDDLHGVRLLLVEDNKMNQMVVKKFFEKHKVEIQVAEDGQAAIDNLQQHDFDIILMDIQMPLMDGYKATEVIRNTFSSPKKDIPIIALTASALSEVQNRIRESGINDYIIKPFNPEQLLTKVIEYIPSKNGEAKTKKEKAPPLQEEAISSPDKHTNLTYLRMASDNNKEFIKDMINIFLKQTPDFIENLVSYEKTKEWAEFRKVMHKMKPTIKMMGIHSLEQDIENIETSVKSLSNLNSVKPLLEKIEKVCNESYNELRLELKNL